MLIFFRRSRLFGTKLWHWRAMGMIHFRDILHYRILEISTSAIAAVNEICLLIFKLLFFFCFFFCVCVRSVSKIFVIIAVLTHYLWSRIFLLFAECFHGRTRQNVRRRSWSENPQRTPSTAAQSAIVDYQFVRIGSNECGQYSRPSSHSPS